MQRILKHRNLHSFFQMMVKHEDSPRGPTNSQEELTYLDQGQHLVLHDGRRVVLGREDFDQNAVDEISVGHKDVEAVATVLHTGLQHLMWRKEM